MFHFQLFHSPMKHKKYMVIIFKDLNKIKTIHFGQAGALDFIEYSKINKQLANQRRKLYINRHSKNENFNDFLTTSFWSRRILWEYPTLQQAIANINLNR